MRKFTKHNGERFNLPICMDQARRGPVRIEFFGNTAVMLSAHHFLELTPERLKELQQELRALTHKPSRSLDFEVRHANWLKDDEVAFGDFIVKDVQPAKVAVSV